jgi:hypothetical protein
MVSKCQRYLFFLSIKKIINANKDLLHALENGALSYLFAMEKVNFIKQ